MRWDIFCTVVDNFGDIGICWRLARQLSNEHCVEVRLWVDNLERFANFSPQISTELDQQVVEGIDVRHWSQATSFVNAAQVVIEAFACHLPVAYVDAMRRSSKPPVWINLEYLSAEEWVEGCHGLESPQSRTSIKKFFFFPGFTRKTGGLIRESDLLEQIAKFDRSAGVNFWKEVGIHDLSQRNENQDQHRTGDVQDELIISLFCYENSTLRELLPIWSQSARPIRLMATAGHATEQVARWLGENLSPGMKRQRNSLTIHTLPFLSQSQYDRLLWSSDLNFVRGEDSFVRAQWAQRPFVWQIYPQSEDAHLVKLDAFLTRYLGGFEAAEAIRAFWMAWNGVGKAELGWQAVAANLPRLLQHGKVWAAELDQVGHLADNLVRFVCKNQFTG